MIQAKTIDGVLLRDMVVAGAALLEKHREAVDALNVFPVPDGDTGTNMSLTMASATREVNQKEYLNAGEAAAEFARRGIRPQVIVVDPPRRGLDESVISHAVGMQPERIVYVSCDPGTLARDLASFARQGYTPAAGVAVDMFPRTSHVETVVLLSRETNPLTVEVRMEVETGEVKEHPTYKRIQEYVQEKYGFKVHTAYIAEVKRMVGLDMHKAPNAVEQRKHEYHPCPPEKVEAIKDALRHFGLISE